MDRNPSASHCVQNVPLDLYNPLSSVLSCGLNFVVISNSNLTSGVSLIIISVSSPSASIEYRSAGNVSPFTRAPSSSKNGIFPFSTSPRVRSRPSIGVITDIAVTVAYSPSSAKSSVTCAHARVSRRFSLIFRRVSDRIASRRVGAAPHRTRTGTGRNH